MEPLAELESLAATTPHRPYLFALDGMKAPAELMSLVNPVSSTLLIEKRSVSTSVYRPLFCHANRLLTGSVRNLYRIWQDSCLIPLEMRGRSERTNHKFVFFLPLDPMRETYQTK